MRPGTAASQECRVPIVDRWVNTGRRQRSYMNEGELAQEDPGGSIKSRNRRDNVRNRSAAPSNI